MKAFILIAVLICMVGCLKPAQAADFDFPRFNLQGDVAYLPLTGKVVACAGTTLVTFYDELVEVRGEVCPAVDGRPALYGGGAMLSLNKVIERIGGTIPDPVKAFKSAVGVGVLGDINLDEIHPAFILTILKVSF